MRTKREGRKRRSSIFSSLLFFMISVGIFPLIFSSYRLIEYNSNVLKRDRQLIHLQLCKSMASEISTYLNYCLGLLTPIDKSLELNMLDKNKSELLLNRVYNTFSGNLKFIEILYLNKKSEIQAGLLNLDDKTTKIINSSILKCLRSSSGIYISKPIYTRTFINGTIVVGKRIDIKGKAYACLIALFSIKKINYSFRRASMAGNVVYLVDIQKGDIIWHPNKEILLKKENISNTPIYGEMVRLDPFVINTFDVKLGKEKKLVSIYRIPYNVVNWGIVVETPESIANADINNMTLQTIKWAILSLIFAVILSFVFSVKIAQPIARLTAWTNKTTVYLRKLSSTIDEGELKELESEYQVKIDVKANNEIGILSDRFREMADTLKEKIKQLQQAAQENRELFKGSIKTLAAAIDAKDPYTRGHSERVTEYSLTIAKELGLSQEDLDNLENAALLHDIGKIGIKDEILQKPGDLTEEEFKIMKLHPEFGAKIIEQIPKLKPSVDGVRYHHERLDGSGYPAGLKGAQIPFAARIIAVADAFDAMTTERPYQKPFTPIAAIDRLKFLTEKGKFDAKIVNALIRAYNKKLIILPDQSEIKKPKYINFNISNDV